MEKTIAVLRDGSGGAPFGACRKLMVQLMPENDKLIRISMDYKKERTDTGVVDWYRNQNG